MSDSRSVLPVLVELATTVAGEDLTNDWLRTVRGGPSAIRIYTPEDLELLDVPLGSARSSVWVDVTGYRTLTAFCRISGTYGGTPYGIEMQGSPVGPGDTWGTDDQWCAVIANRSNLNTVGKFLVANAGVGNYASSTNWTGCIARKVRIDLGPAGADATGSVYLLCLP